MSVCQDCVWLDFARRYDYGADICKSKLPCSTLLASLQKERQAHKWMSHRMCACFIVCQDCLNWKSGQSVSIMIIHRHHSHHRRHLHFGGAQTVAQVLTDFKRVRVCPVHSFVRIGHGTNWCLILTLVCQEEKDIHPFLGRLSLVSTNTCCAT